MGEAVIDTSPAKTKSPFWTFSLRIYGQPGVPPACLTLQDGSGVDVNVLLFALYAASCGKGLTSTDLTRIITSIDPWKLQAVVPLRGVRRFLKDTPAGFASEGVEELRKRVKAVELESERLQQETLYAMWPVNGLGNTMDPAEAARTNASAYESALNTKFDAEAIATLLGAFQNIKE
jgi:uncharacterized protein (TIGR02444 family)